MTLISARSRLAIAAGVAALPLVAIRRARAAPEFSFRLDHPLTAADAVQTSMLSFADNLKKRTDGRIEVTVFPNDGLGSQADVGEMIRQGGAVMAVTDDLFLGIYVPDAAVLQAPFLMDRPEQFNGLIGSAWLNDLTDRLAAKGTRVICWNAYFGTRQILSKKPIREPADLKDLNFRCAAAPMYVEMEKAMGGRPIVTDFASVYTGLAQGTLDLLEAPLPTMWASKYYEQAKYVCLTSHMIGWDALTMSEASYRKLPPDLQKIVQEEAFNAGQLMGKLKRQQEADIIPQYEAAGCTIVRDVDREAFKRLTAPIYDHYPGFTPGIRTTVQALLSK
jgi:TRAP-type C4-dicarboxylate transport system substrate-binding protein